VTKEGAMGKGVATRIVAVLAAVLALTACSGTSTEKPPPDQGPRTFTYSTNSEVIVGWDPSSENSNSIIAMANIYDTLTRYDSETQELEPSLATAWETSDDGLKWTFTIRDGVTFHTGRAMTADDVVASIQRTIDLGQGAAYIWSPVKSLEATDDTTVVFDLKYPAPLDLIASAGYAAYVFDTQAVSGDLAKWFEEGNDAGTGPYQVDSWNKGQEVELRLNAYPDYWGGWDGNRYERVVFRVTPEATTAAQLLRDGQVTFVERMTPQLFESFKGDGSFQTVEATSWQNLLGLLNTRSGPLADADIRKAVSYGIDYEGILTALKGAAAPSTGVVPPGLWGHFDDLPTYTYDPEQAKQLLAAKGYGPGGKALDLTLTYTQGDADEELIGSLMKSNLADLNINLDVRGLQWQTQWSKGKSSDESERQDIFVFYWWPDYADPISWFASLFHCEDKVFFNLSYYCNTKLDQMIDSVETYAATDRDQAIQMYRDMQQILYDDQPAMYLYNQNYQHAMLAEVQGFVDNPAYPNVAFVRDLEFA
jgi:peptide/nickel transport system substrate-binding protein